MKHILAILLTAVMLCACYRDDYLGDEHNTKGKNIPVFIFDDKLLNVNDETCQVVGFVNDTYSINRRCKLINGYVEIGTNNVFPNKEYHIMAYVIIKDTIFMQINGIKQIVTR